MRVLIVAALPPERPSFIGRTFPLARALTTVGHDVDLVTLSGAPDGPFRTVENRDDVRIRTVGPNVRPTRESLPSLMTGLTRLRAGTRALMAAARNERPAVVILEKPQLQNTGAALRVARVGGYPLLVDLDDLEAHASRFPFPLRWAAASLERRAMRTATAVTACSPYLVERARHVNPHATVTLVPTGIDVPSAVAPAHVRARFGIPRDHRVMLYVGSLSMSSGHRVDLLLDAFAGIREHPSTKNSDLVIAGDGLDEERIRAQAHASRTLRGAVHFWGHFSPPEDLALAREADLIVDPIERTATVEAKSSHRTLLALAMGTPIVTGNIGIRPLLLPSSVHDYSLYNPDSLDDFRRKIHQALDPGTRSTFRTATMGLIDQWRWENLGRTFVALVESLRFPG